jgi:uncharacterized protein (TIGR02147 family)
MFAVMFDKIKKSCYTGGMNIFEYEDYKKWVNDKIKIMPKKGRGQYRRLSEHLSTNSAVITQVFKGDRQLTPEQAIALADFFGMSKEEQRFLILLVNYARAGSYRYKKILKEDIELQKLNYRKIFYRVPRDRDLSDEAKSVLYSNWYYLAIWSLTAIPGFDQSDSISERLGISKKKVREAIDFLLKHSLIVEKKSKLQIGPKLIHLEAESPLISRHHQNWRLRAFTKYEESRGNDAFYSAPVTLSQADVVLIREKIIQFISESVDLIKNSPSEKLYCLCLDWFEV